jgi:hypothetical protein
LPAIERFRYHAETTGLTGRITLPFDQTIPPQASVTLPEAGGFVHAKVDNFNFRDIILFDRAVAFAAGSFSVKEDAFDATAAGTLEGLNILNVITADRVTARIASSHPKSGAEPRITPTGSSFENLRIAGYKVEVDLAPDLFCEFDTASGLKAAAEAGAGDKDAAGGVKPLILETLASGEMSCTLVRSIRGLGKEITVRGNVIRIPGFGVIRLAQIFVSPHKRRVSMLQFDLGSTPDGAGQAGGAEGNGTGN